MNSKKQQLFPQFESTPVELRHIPKPYSVGETPLNNKTELLTVLVTQFSAEFYTCYQRLCSLEITFQEIISTENQREDAPKNER